MPMLRSAHGHDTAALWCSMLSDLSFRKEVRAMFCLNAPYGAPCFLTVENSPESVTATLVLMHLMVPRAF